LDNLDPVLTATRSGCVTCWGFQQSRTGRIVIHSVSFRACHIHCRKPRCGIVWSLSRSISSS